MERYVATAPSEMHLLDGPAHAAHLTLGSSVRFGAQGTPPRVEPIHASGAFQPPFLRPSPQVTSEALPSPMPSRLSRPRYPVLRAAPTGRPQRAGGAARAGGTAWPRAAEGTGQKCLLNFLYSPRARRCLFL